MNIIHAIVLGLIQGVAEALPISSSAHLALYKHFANAKEVPIFFDVLLHVATLFSIFIVFRKKILALIASFFRFVVRKKCEDDKYNLFQIAIILLSSLITAVVGFALKDLVKNFNVRALPIGFCATGILLLVSKNARLKEVPSFLRTAAILGVAQGFAVFPGLSRSGSTISILLMLGFSKDEVGEFSFILSIPVVMGAALLEGVSAYKSGLPFAMDALPIVSAMFTAFFCCLITLTFFLRIIKNGRLARFACYLFPLAILLHAYFFFWNA